MKKKQCQLQLLVIDLKKECSFIGLASIANIFYSFISLMEFRYNTDKRRSILGKYYMRFVKSDQL